ncbi:uncharacterized protein B0I36DRAFT_390567 [Microdochium trichocladiopsis]|uniref:Apple domain-containing protein n=1 Tax=Microdochium trichocladiopsis TaxID=1682393 RepID=A0A9P8YH27_9PEZI|nr:uncharacterized protein B0I36DRAFT_390567 [Microdochium trichocladiopsis]KAH7039813.1 hypothetical protein B0I36DRAFT_390567 [Microdochium trichocladiopsis]
MAVTILVSYLLNCIDSLLGHYPQALLHLKGGIELARQITPAVSSQCEASKPALRDTDAMLSQITRQLRRLDLQATLYMGEWTPRDLLTTWHLPDTELSSSLNTGFTSLEQASDVLEILIAQVMHLRNSPRQGTVFPATEPGFSIVSSARSTILADLESWAANFQALVFSDTHLSRAKYRTISLLRLRHRTATMFLATYGPVREAEYDAYLPSFRQCLALAVQVAAMHVEYADNTSTATAGRATFAPTVGLIPVLYIIGVKCRHLDVRSEALEILQRLSIKEAVWDNRAAARVVKRVIEIEENSRIVESGAGPFPRPLCVTGTMGINETTLFYPAIWVFSDLPLRSELKGTPVVLVRGSGASSNFSQHQRQQHLSPTFTFPSQTALSMRPRFVLAALAAAISPQVNVGTNPVPDALDVEYLVSLPDLQVDIIPGLSEQTVSYDAEAAVATAASDVEGTPLSVFPAATSEAINSAGETPGVEPSTSGRQQVAREYLEPRAACAAEPNITNFYNVDVYEHYRFKFDSKIASLANDAPIPAGYFQNYKNLWAASIASAYLGYTVLKTGYDVEACARKCSAKPGCLAFNIIFERDPLVTPGPGCEEPLAFANIKCSFWGVPLTAATATNKGEMRAKFRVGIAGSNAYTSYRVGGPVDSFDTPLSLGNAALNAPLTDCAGTWTYLGYKLYRNQPFDSRLCAAACDAQTAYNIEHPPSSGKPALCGGFGTYLLHKTNSAGSSIVGQMCTLYTSAHDAEHATNTAEHSGDTKFTYSNSFFYARPDCQPLCSSTLEYLKSEGQEFCSSVFDYLPPSTTVYTTAPPLAAVFVTKTVLTTAVTTVGGSPDAHWKRRGRFARQEELSLTSTEASPAALPDIRSLYDWANSVAANVETVDNLGPYTIAILTQTVVEAAPTNGTAALTRRAVATPTPITGWPSSRISEACLAIATNVMTVVGTTTPAALTRTATTLQTTTATSFTNTETCAVLTMLAEYRDLIPVFGTWDKDQLAPGPNPYPVDFVFSTILLPFPLCFWDICTKIISPSPHGLIYLPKSEANGVSVLLNVYAGVRQYLYPGWNLGVFTRVTGPLGNRQFTMSWYTSTWDFGHAKAHYSVTWYENMPQVVYYKYYDAVQVYANTHSVEKDYGGPVTHVWPVGQFMKAGTQIRIEASPDGNVTYEATQRNRVDCCTDVAGWHSCTEWQPQIL